MRAYVAYCFAPNINNSYGFRSTIKTFKYDKPTMDELIELENDLRNTYSSDRVVILSVIPVEEEQIYAGSIIQRENIWD